MNRPRLPIIFLLSLLSVWEGLPNLALCQHNDPFHDAHLVAEQFPTSLINGHYSHKGTAITVSPLDGETHCPTSALIPLSCSAVFFRSFSPLNLFFQSSNQPTLYWTANPSFFFSHSPKLSLPLQGKVHPDNIQLTALRTVVLLN